MTSPIFPWLPPEINSVLIRTGAGSGPLFNAAAAWNGLASDLGSVASSFDSLVSGLASGGWRGPTSLLMTAAAAPYVGWLTAAAEQAAAASAQAQTAAAAFEGAQGASVHPAAVTANRVQLTSLIATNAFGQNAPAIAMTELEYLEMWAQDVAAMFGYHGAAMSVASALPSFSVPPVPLGGLSNLALSAVTTLSSLPPATELSGLVGEVGEAVPSAVSEVSSLSSPLMSVAEFGTMPISMLMSPMMSLAQGAGQAAPAVAGAANMAADLPKFVGEAAPAMKGLGTAAGGLGSVSAGLGHARLVGAMSVPPTWSGSIPGKMISSAMSGLGWSPNDAIASGASSSASGMPMMPPMMPMGGGGVAGAPLGRGGASPHVAQARPSVVPRTGVG